MYLETRAPGADVGEILRRFGLHVNDLRRIEASVEGAAIEDAIAQGLTARAACAVLGLSERRWRTWRARARLGDFERHGVYVSHVSIWLFERELGIAGHRGKRQRMGVKRPEAQDTRFLEGPNQLWAWDITKLRTGVPQRFWYLYVVMNQWSRKVVGWHVGERETSAEGQRGWDEAVLAEGCPPERGEGHTELKDRATGAGSGEFPAPGTVDARSGSLSHVSGQADFRTTSRPASASSE